MGKKDVKSFTALGKFSIFYSFCSLHSAKCTNWSLDYFEIPCNLDELIGMEISKESLVDFLTITLKVLNSARFELISKDIDVSVKIIIHNIFICYRRNLLSEIYY